MGEPGAGARVMAIRRSFGGLPGTIRVGLLAAAVGLSSCQKADGFGHSYSDCILRNVSAKQPMAANLVTETRQICFEKYVKRGNKSIPLASNDIMADVMYHLMSDDAPSVRYYDVEFLDRKSFHIFQESSGFSVHDSSQNIETYRLERIDGAIPTRIMVSVSAYAKNSKPSSVVSTPIRSPEKIFEVKREFDAKPDDRDPIILRIWGPKSYSALYRYEISAVATEYLRN